MNNYCYFNGKILPTHKAKVSLNDLGLLRGYGVFDFMRTYNGKPFLLDEHLSRFQRSANGLDLRIPISVEKIKTIIKELLIRNKFKEAGIRLVLTGGPTIDSMTYTKPVFFILIEPFKDLPNKVYTKGIKLITHEHHRELAHLKTINYLTSIQLTKKLKTSGAFEVLYYANKKVLECSRSNIFIFRKNELITPKKNVLMGIRRELVLEIAKLHYAVNEKDISLPNLYNADEVFITSTGRAIIPVVEIDNKKIGNGIPGERTKYLMKLFEEITIAF